jgi:hypothetical protein
LAAMPEIVQVQDARAALASKVFTTVAGESTPRHRTIAEFLAARALAKCINEGLPLGRVLALMQGFDGKPVAPLRGLWAWLAVFLPTDRSRLIQLDPLGVVLNGDVAAFGTTERIELLTSLSPAVQGDAELSKNMWVSHPFGPLATADMVDTYEVLLRNSQRDDVHLTFMYCVFAALQHGERMPALAAALEAWVQDDTAWMGLRVDAYRAWVRHAPADCQLNQQKAWLARLQTSELADPDSRLTGEILTHLYPEHVGPGEVFKFWRRASELGLQSSFWSYHLLRRSRPQDRAELADAWVQARPTSTPTGDPADNEVQALSRRVLIAALKQAGESATTQRLYTWLGLCIDEHGSSAMRGQTEVAQWLEAHPERLKAVVTRGFGLMPPEKKHLFWVEQHLHGAKKPADWLLWLLSVAAATNDEALVQQCFQSVARTVIDPAPTRFDLPSKEDIERWVAEHFAQWPKAPRWLEGAWSSSLEEIARRQRDNASFKHGEAQRLQWREERKRRFQPLLAGLTADNQAIGEFSFDLACKVAQAHENRYSGIRGDTPLERVQDLLVTDAATAQAALAALYQVLMRNDLPSADEVLAADAQGNQHPIQLAALLAAQRSFERAPDSPLAWPQALAQTLIAFCLVEFTGNTPAWYRCLVAQKPQWVAPVLVRLAEARLKKPGNRSIQGLWALSREADHRELARLVVPPLLEGFPKRAAETSRACLNDSLLAALPLLDPEQAGQIVESKLAQPGLDPLQKISWWVAQLAYRPEAVNDLADWVGGNEQRAVALGAALREQGPNNTQPLPPNATRRLLEVLLPITPRRDPVSGSRWVGETELRESAVHSLLVALSNNPSPAARDELRALTQCNQLGAWKNHVDSSVKTQQAVAREANFQVATPVEVANTIANLAPANPADLQALVVQHLKDLQANLRGDDTFLLRQFWSPPLTTKKNRTTQTPVDENFCRDLLLDKLRGRLNPLNIHGKPEVRVADDKRADAQVEFMRNAERITLPIEVKKEDHKALWTAWRDQLQRLYAIDPAAGGHGLYLVLWFGHQPRSTPEGIRPCDANHLHDLLLKRIPPADQHVLTVHVLDLSWP